MAGLRLSHLYKRYDNSGKKKKIKKPSTTTVNTTPWYARKATVVTK